MRFHILLPAAAGTLVASSSVLAVIEILYTTDLNIPTSIVPPGAGVPKGSLFDDFDRPFVSPKGQYWVLSCDRFSTTLDDDEMIMVGSGATGAPVLLEGQPAPWEPGQNVGGIAPRIDINDSGHFIFSNNTEPATTLDDYLVLWNGSRFVTVVQEGDVVPGAPGRGTAGTTINSANINNSGTVGFFTVAGVLPPSSNDLGMFGSTVQFQQGFVPSGQSGTPAAPDTFSSDLFYNSEDGSQWIIRCSLPGSVNDDMAVVTGAVVAQEGSILPGSSFTSPVASVSVSTNIGQVLMMHNGDWFVRGSNEDGEDWIIRNGVVVASTGDPITPPSAELYDDATLDEGFFFMQGNDKGDYVIGGVTNVDASQDRVMVLNGEHVILREGMPLDLNDNGQADDDAFIASFDNDHGFLTDDLMLYCVVQMRSTTASIGQAFIRVDLVGPTPCQADTDGNGAVDVDDLISVILGWGACRDCLPTECASDTDDDCDTDVDDLAAVILSWGGCE